jgi:hypothetical protein
MKVTVDSNLVTGSINPPDQVRVLLGHVAQGKKGDFYPSLF